MLTSRQCGKIMYRDKGLQSKLLEIKHHIIYLGLFDTAKETIAAHPQNKLISCTLLYFLKPSLIFPICY